MSDRLKDFEQMEVWQDARQLAVDVYRDFSTIKDFSFCDQIKRAVVSISNNIAEGAGRTTSADFARFLDEVRVARRWRNFEYFAPRGSLQGALRAAKRTHC